MKKLSFLASRWFAALLVLVVVSLATWFLGPYLTFGELRPLADPAMRVALIALLLLGVLLWLRGLPTSPVFVVLLCLLVWNAAPLIGVGQSQPFGPVSARIAALAVILGCFALYVLIRLFHRMRTDRDFLNKALSFGSKAEPAPAAGRLRQIEVHMNGALARLKSMRTGARGVAKLFQGTRYLYELPWYVAIGSNQCGKTSALLQSGLQFPHGYLTGRATGTQGVDWWLTNDAVLIDTAGHYARHGTSTGPLPARVSTPEPSRTNLETASDDSQWRRIVDADEWRGFMALLRRRRPRLPINGALLTVKLDVLTTPDASVRTAEATAIRARLEELREQLGVAFPVYLLITQTDRLPGFSDYFGSLTKEHRAQIWGFTLPLGAENSGMRCTTELAQLAERLSRGLNARLDDEYDVTRRRRLAVLPEAYDALQAPLVDFVSQLFAESRYDTTQSHANLRGVYFTSAMQSGEQIKAEPLTVVQRLESSLGQTAGRDGQPAQSAHGFFLDDLFSRVILPEAHLVRPNLRQEYRSRALRVLGHGLALLLFGWLAVSLFTSYGNNREYLAAIGNKTRALASRVTQLYRSPAPEAVPDTLTDAHTLPAWTGLDLDDPDSSNVSSNAR